MGDEAEPAKRRRRRVATRAEGAPQPAKEQATDPAIEAQQPRRTQPPRKAGPARKAPAARRARDGDGGLRDLVGAGPSKLGVTGALRARDVNRPTDADLAEAERDLVIVRRNWKPQH